MELRDLVDGALDEPTTVAVRGDGHVEVVGLTHDSRRVAPGDVFCCVPGTTADGHDFAEAAVEAGAAALIVECFLDVDVPQVLVPDVRAAMGPLAAEIHGRPSAAMKVCGVTGTNGKTTTTFLLESIGRAAGLVPGVVGTVATRIAGRTLDATLTTPEAPDLQALLARMRDQGVGLVAMEVSSHALSQGRVDGVEFAAATFLNLSHDHLDYHGSLDAYFAAKAQLFDARRTRAAAVNVGDERGPGLATRCRDVGIETITFAVGAVPDVGGADLVAQDVSVTSSGIEFVLDGPATGEPCRIRTPLSGSFNVTNALAAAATAFAAGLPEAAVVDGLAHAAPVPGRFESVERGQDFTAVVDYAHTPDALAAVLEAGRELAAGRVMVVFGCGGDRDRQKRPAMGRVAGERADVVYVTSDNPRSEDPRAIVDEILEGVPKSSEAVVELDRRTAIGLAVSEAGPGDVVIVAGKGHETGQTIGSEVRPFEDRRAVGEAIDTLAARSPKGRGST